LGKTSKRRKFNKSNDDSFRSNKFWEKTSKRCPNCGNEKLALLRTLNLKRCADCNTNIEWPLNEGQKPVGYKIEDADNE